MEYVGKRTLLSLTKDHPEAVTEHFQGKCFREIASALEYVHSAGIVHLDVKPANILVSSKADFLFLKHGSRIL